LIASSSRSGSAAYVPRAPLISPWIIEANTVVEA